jgi:hypothetical protein
MDYIHRFVNFFHKLPSKIYFISKKKKKFFFFFSLKFIKILKFLQKKIFFFFFFLYEIYQIPKFLPSASLQGHDEVSHITAFMYQIKHF